MRQVLTALGLVFVALAGLRAGDAAEESLGSVPAWAQPAGAKMQEVFFAAVLTGDARKVTALFHPALSEEVDEPVLSVWIAAVKQRLGAYSGLRKNEFSTSWAVEGDHVTAECEGAVDFEKGAAKSVVKFYDGKLVKFNVTSDKIAGPWFQGPASTELYRGRAKAFLTHFLKGEPDAAFEMMHSALQKDLPLDKLKAMIEKVTGQAGALKSVEYASEEATPGDIVNLKILCKVECEKAKTMASVRFQFVGLKGHLVAFDLSGE